MLNGIKLAEKFTHGRTTIDNDILMSDELTPTEKIVYMYIEMLSNKDGFCTATSQQMGDMVGQTKKSMVEAIQKLKKKKYIVVDTLQSRNPKRRIFTAIRHLKAWSISKLPKDCTIQTPVKKIDALDRDKIQKSMPKFIKFMKNYLQENKFDITTNGGLKGKQIVIKKNGFYRNISDDIELTKEEAFEFEALLFDKAKVILDAFFIKS